MQNSLSLLRTDQSESPMSAPVQTLEGFNQLLNEDVPANEVEINSMAGNSKYIPISFVQMLLDKYFVGLWETKNFTYSVIANEIVGKVTLRFYHPFAKVWIEREGSAAVMIQQRKGAEVSDINAKIKNTLAKDQPHLLASCTASAARTIGKRFGRDLNRKFEDSYSSFYTEMAESEVATSAIDWGLVKTEKDLLNVWKAHSDLQNNSQFKKTFTYHKNKLKK